MNCDIELYAFYIFLAGIYIVSCLVPQSVIDEREVVLIMVVGVPVILLFITILLRRNTGTPG